MRINHFFKKEGNRVIATTMTWETDGQTVSVEIDSDVNGVFSEALDQIVIEDYISNKVFFYSKSGVLQKEIPLPKLNGHSFRGLNRNDSSETGVALIYYPESEVKKYARDDMVQYELLISPPYIGKYLDIYR